MSSFDFARVLFGPFINEYLIGRSYYIRDEKYESILVILWGIGSELKWINIVALSVDMYMTRKKALASCFRQEPPLSLSPKTGNVRFVLLGNPLSKRCKSVWPPAKLLKMFSL